MILDTPKNAKRKYRRRPQPLCPCCRVPLLTYSTHKQVRYLKCPECSHTSKQLR